MAPDQSVTRLTPTSYIVLGFLSMREEATPYDLKQLVAVSVGNFWSFPHSQLYAEPERLAAAGYVRERREQGGRRRRVYSITQAGRKALETWREEPEGGYELRDPALLKVFFGGDPAPLARARLEHARAKLEEYEALRTGDTGEEPRGIWLSLEAGIEHAKADIRFWSKLAAD